MLPELAEKPKYDIGKWKNSIACMKLENVPPPLLELFHWVKSIKTKDVEPLLELKNFYKLMKASSFKQLVERLLSGKVPTPQEIKYLRLIKDTIVDMNKMEFGEKTVVEHEINVKDIRRAMMADHKKIVDVEAKDVS